MAEWLGSGLQNRLQRFESARDLTKALLDKCLRELFYFIEEKSLNLWVWNFKKVRIMRKFLLFSGIIFSSFWVSVFGQSYGSSSANLPIGEHISQVLFGTQSSWGANDILNPSTTTFSSNCAKYSDFTIGNTNPTDGNLSNSVYVASVEKGVSYNFLLQGAACGAANGQKQVKVYIDYNDDGDFVDLGEDVGYLQLLA